MTEKLDLSILTRGELEAFAQHLLECQDVLLANNNGLITQLHNEGSMNEAQEKLLEQWSRQANAILERSHEHVNALIDGSAGQTLN